MDILSFITNLNPEVVIQGGLSLAVIGLIWLNATSNKRYFNHTSDVISHNSKVIVEQAKTNQKLSDSIDNLVTFLKRK